MIEEAEQSAKEDCMVKEQMDARSRLKSYLYNLKNKLEGQDSNIILANNKKELFDLVDKTLDCGVKEDLWKGWRQARC
jgi:molecular chaperone DnaK (HSP70)